MGSLTIKVFPQSLGRRSGMDCLYGHEKVLLLFFATLGGLSLLRPLPATSRVALLAVPATVWLLCWAEEHSSRPWSRIVREWMSLALILAAYWSLQFFAQAHWTRWQDKWIAWDRWLLHDLEFKRGIESWGSFLPTFLETIYLLLYIFPVVSLGLLYVCGERSQSKRFLHVLFLGTLTAYALLPVLPVSSPRLAFPGEDLPAHTGTARTVNVWLLDHLDISTSVFPSGHVAVAFSCAFGLLSAIPHQKKIWVPAFFVATAVFAATIYSRYHYAADGLASIAIAVAAWSVLERFRCDEA